jgi:hypothetical protein
VVALSAVDGSPEAPIWTFNPIGSSFVGRIVDTPTLDPAADRLYVGTLGDPGSVNTLYAIDVLRGVPAWTANPGSLATAPVLGSDRIYVGSEDGYLSAYQDATLVSGNHRIWGDIHVPGITRRLAVDSNLIVVVDALGAIHRFQDNGIDASELGLGTTLPYPAVVATGATLLDLGVGNVKAYVGANDGSVWQLDAWHGFIQQRVLVAPRGQLTDGAIVQDADPNGAPRQNLVFGSSSGDMAKFATPWVAAPPAGG